MRSAGGTGQGISGMEAKDAKKRVKEIEKMNKDLVDHKSGISSVLAQGVVDTDENDEDGNRSSI